MLTRPGKDPVVRVKLKKMGGRLVGQVLEYIAGSMPPPDGFVSLTGKLTAFVSDTTMALVDDGVALGSRQLDKGNSKVDTGRV